MARYYTRVAMELFDDRENRPPVAGFRFVRDLGPAGDRTRLIEFEDDDAPAELAGHVVTPTLTQIREDGRLQVFVSDRTIDWSFDVSFQHGYRAGWAAAQSVENPPEAVER